MNKYLIVILIVVVLVGGYGWMSYNKLVVGQEGITSQWAQVETQYQRRLDLVPNLVASVKGIMTQEQTIFTALAEARTRYAGASSVADKAKAASDVETSLGRLLVVVENYPILKSSEAVQTLMTQLEGTENRVSVERKRYNDMVQSYNLVAKRFPSSLIAKLTGFEVAEYFEAAAGAENAPQVNL